LGYRQTGAAKVKGSGFERRRGNGGSHKLILGSEQRGTLGRTPASRHHEKTMGIDKKNGLRWKVNLFLTQKTQGEKNHILPRAGTPLKGGKIETTTTKGNEKER